jgi:hypothetical protein
LAETHEATQPRQPKENMSRTLGIALLIVGLLLTIMGITESDSFSSEVSRFFTGNPTDRSMWLLVGGIASIVVGALMSGIRALKS